MTLRQLLPVSIAALVFVVFAAESAPAQPLGTFRWQLAPFCNVVAVSVTQAAGTFTLDGFDDQCGATTRASVVGTAFPNPDGTIGIGLSIVATPGGAPVHIDVALNLATLGGSWRDSAGNTGTWVFNPATPAPGSPRPAPGGTGADAGDITAVSAGAGLAGGGTTGDVALAIDPAQTQQRITGACAAEQAMLLVNQDGSVVCGPAPPGDITAVAASTGLKGGGTAGAVALAVAFDGPGTLDAAARSDHAHQVAGGSNTAIGGSALAHVSGVLNTAVGLNALRSATTGNHNTAVGAGALASSTTGGLNVAVGHAALAKATNNANTAVGAGALEDTTTGSQNTGIGTNALASVTTGSANTALGIAAADAVTTGSHNAGVGANVFSRLTGGSFNVAVGSQAGSNLTSGDDNVYIGSRGPSAAASESGRIRIGTNGTQTNTFIAGISGASVSSVSDQAVLVDATGKLGTTTSSARFKEDIRPLAGVSRAVLRLEPVSFRYTPDQNRGDAIQYGLIAEQVAEVMPELVIRDEGGHPFTVKYHVLPALLLAEIQRLERERAQLTRRLDALSDRVNAMEQERR